MHKKLISTFMTLAILQSAEASNKIQECERLDAAQQVPKSMDLEGFLAKCKDTWQQHARYKKSNADYALYAKGTSVLIVHQGNANVLSGLTTGIERIDGFDHSSKRAEFYILNSAFGTISTFSLEQHGSVPPIRIIEDSRLVGATSILAIDSTNQLLVSNPKRKEILAFNLDGHSHTGDKTNKAKVLGAIFDASKGIIPQSLVMENISADTGIIGVLDASSKGIVLLRSDFKTGKFKLLNNMPLASKGVPLETIGEDTRLFSKDSILHLEIAGKEHSLGGMKLSDIVQFQ